MFSLFERRRYREDPKPDATQDVYLIMALQAATEEIDSAVIQMFAPIDRIVISDTAWLVRTGKGRQDWIYENLSKRTLVGQDAFVVCKVFGVAGRTPPGLKPVLDNFMEEAWHLTKQP